ncbi:hypothetical protein V6N11_055022 [Hibiscus sabdariffa]|uniref:Uncharacterized protein n=2 Tax=Hibiscus sabdariffa TaxID=183260 RepID=A0ABR2P3N1_9ROSI
MCNVATNSVASLPVPDKTRPIHCRRRISAASHGFTCSRRLQLHMACIVACSFTWLHMSPTATAVQSFCIFTRTMQSSPPAEADFW